MNTLVAVIIKHANRGKGERKVEAVENDSKRKDV